MVINGKYLGISTTCMYIEAHYVGLMNAHTWISESFYLDLASSRYPSLTVQENIGVTRFHSENLFVCTCIFEGVLQKWEIFENVGFLAHQVGLIDVYT